MAIVPLSFKTTTRFGNEFCQLMEPRQRRNSLRWRRGSKIFEWQGFGVLRILEKQLEATKVKGVGNYCQEDARLVNENPFKLVKHSKTTIIIASLHHYLNISFKIHHMWTRSKPANHSQHTRSIHAIYTQYTRNIHAIYTQYTRIIPHHARITFSIYLLHTCHLLTEYI